MKRNKNLRRKRSESKTKNAKSSYRRHASRRSNRNRFKFSKNLLSKPRNAKKLSKNRQISRESKR